MHIWYTLPMRFSFLLVPAALILLSGCSGPGGHPASTPSATAAPTGPATTSASATPTPSPTATTPLLTGAAVKPGEVPATEDPHFITDDSGGAIAFAGYFYRALDWSIATTNPNLLRAISAPPCTGCQQYIQKLDRLAAEGGRTESGRLSVSSYAPIDGSFVQADYVIEVSINQDPNIVVDGSGDRETFTPTATPAINDLYVSWVTGPSKHKK
jgi:Family of unknown function (DUF6318)